MHFVAFDLGNVLIDLSWDNFWKEVGSLYNYVDGDWDDDSALYLADDERKEEALNTIKHILNNECMFDFCGQTRFSNVVKNKFGESLGSDITKAWNNMIKPNEQMTNFVKNLKSDGFKVAFLSNMGFDHLNYLNENYPDFMSLADIKHMSCEVGAAKPSLLFFQSFLLGNEEFAGCMYLDDLKENIAMASKVKFDAMHFDLNNYYNQKPSELKRKLDSIRKKLLLRC